MNAIRWRVVRAAAMGIVLTVLVTALAILQEGQLRAVRDAEEFSFEIVPTPREWGVPTYIPTRTEAFGWESTWRRWENREVVELRAGWPMRSFVASRAADLQGHELWPGSLRRGIPGWHYSLLGVGNFAWAIPLMPQTGPVLINILVWGGFAEVAGWGYRRVRRFARTHTGKCVVCGYRLNGIVGCPECGAGTVSRSNVARS